MTEYGVIIGRFQVPSLHDGHKGLIDRVRARHKKVIILVGSTPGILVTRRNPLDYHTRMLMIREAYPDISILPINDMPSDTDWSKSVDRRIMEASDGNDSVTLYGSRDSFIPHYLGKFKIVELESSKSNSGTEIRERLSDDVRISEDFRLGVIYAAFHRHKCVYPTVDIVLYKANEADEILLGRKASDPIGLWRFPGGFVDPEKDKSFEDAALRELSEEVGNPEVCHPQFITSLLINDWRYKNELDKVFTTVFKVRYIFGIVEAGDDLDQVKWFPLNNATRNIIMPQHQPIFDAVLGS